MSKFQESEQDPEQEKLQKYEEVMLHEKLAAMASATTFDGMSHVLYIANIVFHLNEDKCNPIQFEKYLIFI